MSTSAPILPPSPPPTIPSSTHWSVEDYAQISNEKLRSLFDEWSVGELTQSIEQKLKNQIIRTRYVKVNIGNQTAGGFLTYMASYVGLWAAYKSVEPEASLFSPMGVVIFAAASHIGHTAQRLLDLNARQRKTPSTFASQGREIAGFLGEVYKEKLTSYKSTSSALLMLGAVGVAFVADHLPGGSKPGTLFNRLRDQATDFGDSLMHSSEKTGLKKIESQLWLEQQTHPEKIPLLCYFALLRQLTLHFTSNDSKVKGTYTPSTSVLDISLNELNPAELIAKGTVDGGWRMSEHMPTLSELALIVHNPNPNFESPQIRKFNERLLINLSLSSIDKSQEELLLMQQHTYEAVFALATRHSLKEHVAKSLSTDPSEHESAENVSPTRSVRL